MRYREEEPKGMGVREKEVLPAPRKLLPQTLSTLAVKGSEWEILDSHFCFWGLGVGAIPGSAQGSVLAVLKGPHLVPGI